MGTCYFLIRDDDQVYDLGKAWEWSTVFGVAPMAYSVDDAPVFAELLADVSKGWDLPADYYLRVAKDISDWADGHWFMFVSEHDGRYDRISEESMDRGDKHRAFITGSRFTNDMEAKAALRSAARH